jgi:hypothetical protein
MTGPGGRRRRRTKRCQGSALGPLRIEKQPIDRTQHMTISNLDKHHLTTSETMFVGANASVIGRARLGDGVSVWPGAVTRGSASALSAPSKSNRLRFARAEP